MGHYTDKVRVITARVDDGAHTLVDGDNIASIYVPANREVEIYSLEALVSTAGTSGTIAIVDDSDQLLDDVARGDEALAASIEVDMSGADDSRTAGTGVSSPATLKGFDTGRFFNVQLQAGGTWTSLVASIELHMSYVRPS